ncbi:MAG: hypothetical protein ACWA5T_06030 [Parvularcula sp.]
MTDQNDQPSSGGQNLIILKGVVWGMGVLLVLGTVLIGVKIASVSSGIKTETEEAGPAASYPPVPLQAGETMANVEVDGGLIVITVEQDGTIGRILTIPTSGGTTWTSIEPAVITP